MFSCGTHARPFFRRQHIGTFTREGAITPATAYEGGAIKEYPSVSCETLPTPLNKRARRHTLVFQRSLPVRSMNCGTKASSVVATTKDSRHTPADTVCRGTSTVSSYLVKHGTSPQTMYVRICQRRWRGCMKRCL